MPSGEDGGADSQTEIGPLRRPRGAVINCTIRGLNALQTRYSNNDPQRSRITGLANYTMPMAGESFCSGTHRVISYLCATEALRQPLREGRWFFDGVVTSCIVLR